MKLKLFKKYFFTTFLIIVISLGIMMMILSLVFNDYIAKSNMQTLDKACSETDIYIENDIKSDGELDLNNLPYLLNTICDVSDTDVFIVNNKGEIIACGCAERLEMGTCLHFATKIDIPKQSEEKAKRFSTLGIYELPHYVSYKELSNNETDAYMVFATSSVSQVKNLISAIWRLYLISAVIPIIIMFFAIYFMTDRMTKPLKQMSEASRAMAKGDFSKRIPVTSDDEIGELAASFNMMTNSLSQLEGMRRSFVANISHELKTPMTTIAGFIDGILDGTIEEDKQNYYLGIVSVEVQRLSRLVQSMLSMARLESGEFVLRPEEFDLNEMFCNIVISQEQRIVKQKIDIKGLDELAHVTVEADKDLIYQVIYNLVDNAIKFTDEGGEIIFKLKAEGKNAIFSIKNSGEGISDTDLPFIFERFYKADKSRSNVKNSTGLGLYIVKTIISAHSGKITVRSKKDAWTEFEVSLPLEDRRKLNG